MASPLFTPKSLDAFIHTGQQASPQPGSVIRDPTVAPAAPLEAEPGSSTGLCLVAASVLPGAKEVPLPRTTPSSQSWLGIGLPPGSQPLSHSLQQLLLLHALHCA